MKDARGYTIPWAYIRDQIALRYHQLPEVIDQRPWHENLLTMKFMTMEARRPKPQMTE